MHSLCRPEARSDRESLFAETASRREAGTTLIEKDFWVCWTLDLLFEHAGTEVLPDLCFKGGTTLSKVYGVIERFSEDIDLSLDRAPFLGAEPDPLVFEGSKSARKKLKDRIMERAAGFLRETTLPFLRSEIFGRLTTPHGTDWNVEVAESPPLTLLFSYPAVFPPGGDSQVRPQVRMEFGLGDRFPAEEHTVRPYAAEETPRMFTTESTRALAVLSIARTFWEKTTALHAFTHAPPAEAKFLSRHYYDTYQLAAHPDAERWISDRDLLGNVLRYKEAFFGGAKNRYDLAREGKIRLVPKGAWNDELQRDYASLREDMLFRPGPDWSELTAALRALEERIEAELA